ncbi:nuclear matrix constituent protein 1-like [Bidens hawaiensis]|uniref:nuclear matrix constituent protein 1-like n=1 Tax=Bidens hawaiensis TaxID=980011 RepID=UPI00404A267B
MYTTQQRVTRSPLSITPRPDGNSFGNPTRHVSGKGKAVAFVDATPPPPPPIGLLNENVNELGKGEGLEDWIRFKEAGLLDEGVMEMKDREALVEKAERLEKELFDYQYNMGLLLIENKELSATAEELKEALAETQEVVKREEAAHFMALSEVEKRYDDLRKALDFEKRCRADLEKALREIGEENKLIKLKSQTSLADANNIVAEIGDKARLVEEKMQQADAKLDDVNRKSSGLDRRLQELENKESVLRSERQSFITAREAWENTYSKQKDDLREWERKLQEGEERLCEGRRIINSREEKVNEIEKTVKLKEKELEDAHNKIASSLLESKKKEDNINNLLSNLVAKEEQAELIRKNLEIKEKELLDLTEKLTAKEKVELQKLLDSHKHALDSERRKFDLEMDEKRRSIEAEMRSKLESVEQKADELNHKEEKLRKLEQNLEKKSTRLNEKEKDIDVKSKLMKETEKSIKAEENKFEVDKKQLLAEVEKLEALKANTDKIKDEITQQEAKVDKEIEKLIITEGERANFTRLQSELKDEIEKCRLQKELIMKEYDDLKNDRLKFEQEWEALDEKKAVVSKEILEFNEEKENFEKKLKSEEERLENEKLSTRDYINQQMEAVRLEKETFEATMKHEESLLVKKYENEHRQFLHDFEKRKQEFEANLQNKRIETERNMQEKEKAFEELREKELDNINYLKEVVRKDFEELKSERERIDKERNEIALNSQKLKEDQLELQNDISDLGVLNKKVKDQREDFVKERIRFIEFVEKLTNCENCGDIIKSYELSDIQVPEVKDDIQTPRTINDNIEKFEGNAANKLKSWVQSTVFKMSPHRKIKHQNDEISESPLPETSTDIDAKVDRSNAPAGVDADNIPNDSHDDGQSYMGSKNEVPEASEQSEMKSGRKKPVRKPKGRSRKTPTVEPVAEENSEKTVGPSTRKRAYAETSFVSGSEMDGGESEVHSESVTTAGGGRGRRKRRQTVVAQPPPTPGEGRYNLRRHKTEDTAPQVKDSTNNRKKKEVSGTKKHETLDVSGTKKHETADVFETKKHETLAAVDTEVASDVSVPLVHVTVSKRTDTEIFDAAFKTPGGDAAGTSGVVKIVKNTEIVEEVDVAHEFQNLDDNEDDVKDDDDDHDDDNEDDGDEEENDDDDDGDDDDDDDGSEQHPGEVSVSRKLWKFFTT